MLAFNFISVSQGPKYVKEFLSIYRDLWILKRQKEVSQLKLWN